MNSKLIDFNLNQRKTKDMPGLQAGDIVKVYRKIKEGGKERIQVFEGMVVAIKGGQSSSPMILVRKVSNGVGVELNLPIYSPSIDKIEVVKKAKVRRSKLYYIRDKSAKSLRLKYKDMASFAAVEKEKAPAVEEAQTEAVDEVEKVKAEKVAEEKTAEAVEEKVTEKKVEKAEEKKKEAEADKK